MTEKLKNIEKKYNIKILYVSLYGSHLFGTNDAFSDIDYKGIYVASKEDILLKRDLDFINQSTNKSNTKNSHEDVDFHLDSLHTWLHLLKKGETGAIDLLFSLWDESSSVYVDADFKDFIKNNYLKLISKNPQAFVGYCISQTKKYNIRGERYNELVKLQNYFKEHHKNMYSKIGETTIHDGIKNFINKEGCKHIGFVIADGPKSSGIVVQLEYLEVLGKKFAPTVSIEYLLAKLVAMEEAYGSRARAASDNVDWKAMSHALRVILEVEELISECFITFPLKQKEYIYKVKQGTIPAVEVIGILEEKIKLIDTLMLDTKLADFQDEAFVKEFILKYYG